MSKKIDYPRAAISKSLELAEAVYDLGGAATIEIVAEHMGRSVGGGFRDIISAAGKYGLVKHTRGNIEVTQLFKDYQLGYSDEEKSSILQTAFMNVPLFKEIYDRFKSQKLPIQILDRLLIREFDVQPAMASRVSKYFVEAGKKTGLMTSDNSFADISEPSSTLPALVESPDVESEIPEIEKDADSETYVVRIFGPGINTTIEINEEEDLEIVQITLKKVKKNLDSRM